ncbi:MAG: sulfite exporter TauE/SafE family protein [Desulfovibrionaceae bacterium]|nr:sulfite exporter TauE/SafE family protein [Desulfovibrionaceae bacterium]
MNLWEICIIALAGLCSGIIKTGVGIGSGIFLLPTLSLAFPAKTALGLGAPLMLASDAIGLRFYWKQWTSRGELLRIMLAAVPGLLVGTVLLPIIPAAGFRMGIGIFGMAYAISYLFPNFAPVRWLKGSLGGVNKCLEGKQVYFYGSLGGVASVLAHAGGLVWSLYLMTSIKDRRVFVGTIVLMFFITNVYKTIAYLVIGALSMQELLAVLPAIPAVWLGSAIGNTANKRMNQELFRKLVLAVIFIVSAKLCF